MLKCIIKLAKLAVVSSTLVVLGTTAVAPAAHAAANIVITPGMRNYCNTHGYTGAIQSGSTPDHKYYGYYCTKSNNNQSYLLIPNNLLPPVSGQPEPALH